MNRTLTPEQLDAINRMDEIAACWRALSNLISPDPDISTPEARDDLALLTGFLNDEYEAARNGLMSPKQAA